MSSYEEIDAGETVWRFDRDFLASNWTCIWGKGCKGINATADESLGHGCCSLGAELDGIDEARDLSAAAATIPAHLFQFHAEANSGTVFADESYSATRVVDGACIFHKMAWCCTEGTDAYVGETSVLDSLGDELSKIVGTEVFVQLRNRMK